MAVKNRIPNLQAILFFWNDDNLHCLKQATLGSLLISSLLLQIHLLLIGNENDSNRASNIDDSFPLLTQQNHTLITIYSRYIPAERLLQATTIPVFILVEDPFDVHPYKIHVRHADISLLSL